MVPFGMKVLNEITHGIFHRLASEEDHAIAVLRLQTAKPAFHGGVQVGSLWWQQNNSVSVCRSRKHAWRVKHVSRSRIQMRCIFQKPVFAVCQIAADLLQPRGIRIWCDARNVHTASFQMHDRKRRERDQSFPCPDFDSREVGGENGLPVSLQERGPCWCSLSVGCWFNAVCLQDVPQPSNLRCDSRCSSVLPEFDRIPTSDSLWRSEQWHPR